MEHKLMEKLPLWWPQEDLFKLLETTHGWRRINKLLQRNRILITFTNGYGVIIQPVAPTEDEPLYALTILRFYGAGIFQHRIAQYLPIPEFHRGDFAATIDLCRQVARLPQRREPLSLPDGSLRAGRLTCRDGYPESAAFPRSTFH